MDDEKVFAVGDHRVVWNEKYKEFHLGWEHHDGRVTPLVQYGAIPGSLDDPPTEDQVEKFVKSIKDEMKAYGEGVWLLSDDRRLWIVPFEWSLDVWGPEDDTFDEIMEVLKRHNGRPNEDAQDEFEEIGLEIVPDILRRWGIVDGYYVA